MAVATKEKSIEERGIHDPLWKMPEIHIGSTVEFHGDGNPNNRGTLGRVIEVSNGSVSLTVEYADGRIGNRVDVVHADDPRLTENPYVRERGTWIYSADTRLLYDLHERVKFLEDMILKK